VPDIKLSSGGSYIVEPVSVYEYDAYGIARVTRSADLKEPYRYGFQGMLRMSEVALHTTIINDYATLFRTYDARTGRWTSHDPVLQPWESTYAGLAGNPAMLTDWFGLTTGGGDQRAASNSDASKPGGTTPPSSTSSSSTSQTGGGHQAVPLVPMVPMTPIEGIGHSYVILNINVVADRPFSLTYKLPSLPISLGDKPERSQSDATSVALVKGGTDALANVIAGTAKVVAGGLIMTAGAATAEIGVGVVVFAVGADLAASGVNQIIYDTPQETVLKQVARGTLETAGVPKEYAEPMASGIEMGVQTIAGGVAPATSRSLTVTSIETVSTPGVVFSAADDVATRAATVLDDVAEAGVVGPSLVDEAAVVVGPGKEVAKATRRGRAPEFPSGTISEDAVLNTTIEYLGEGYREVSPGRYVSVDGLRQVRYGRHEVRVPGNHHVHFEALDELGRVVENAVVRIE